MATCPYTGITIPECSCSACLQAQVRRHHPALFEIRIARPADDVAERRRQPQRRAA